MSGLSVVEPQVLLLLFACYVLGHRLVYMRQSSYKYLVFFPTILIVMCIMCCGVPHLGGTFSEERCLFPYPRDVLLKYPKPDEVQNSWDKYKCVFWIWLILTTVFLLLKPYCEHQRSKDVVLPSATTFASWQTSPEQNKTESQLKHTSETQSPFSH